jgi:hypothetical protein
MNVSAVQGACSNFSSKQSMLFVLDLIILFNTGLKNNVIRLLVICIVSSTKVYVI